MDQQLPDHSLGYQRQREDAQLAQWPTNNLVSYVGGPMME